MYLKKEKRLAFIRQVISKNEIKTQEQLVKELENQGLHVTQATVSRDIRELNLIKVPSKSGGSKYGFIGENNYQNPIKLKSKMQDALVNLERIDYFILLKTLPGYAHSVGVLLDEIEWKEKAATLCGNDTCMVICRTREDAEELEKRLYSLL